MLCPWPEIHSHFPHLLQAQLECTFFLRASLVPLCVLALLLHCLAEPCLAWG